MRKINVMVNELKHLDILEISPGKRYIFSKQVLGTSSYLFVSNSKPYFFNENELTFFAQSGMLFREVKPSERAIQIAAGCWQKTNTQGIEMISELCMEFAYAIDEIMEKNKPLAKLSDYTTIQIIDELQKRPEVYHVDVRARG